MEPLTSLRLRARLPLLWLAALLLASLLIPDRTWTTLLVGMGGLFGLSYAWAHSLRQGLRGERRLRFGWVAVGDRLSEAFTIRNDSVLPAFWVEVADHSNLPGYSPAIVRSAGSKATVEWQQQAICRQRGQFQLGPWSLQTSDPFGLFEVTVTYPVADEIIIHPPIHSELPIPLPAGQSSGRTRARERSWQATLNAAGVRDHRPQDPYRWIHWPTTARRDALFVREFDLDAAGEIWLLLDLEAEAQLGSGPQGTEEHMVLVAASLAARALHENRAIGLATYGQQPQIVPPGQGEGQQWRLLHNLALVRADGSHGLARALQDMARVARRGSAAIIITPTGESSWLPALFALSQSGIQGNLLLLDRSSFGGEGNSRALQQAVQGLGFSCHLLRQGEVGRPAAEQVQRGFWEFKTLATGKVVVVKRPDER